MSAENYDSDAVFGGKVEALPGDKDVFGDGSVIVLSTPGHTSGSGWGWLEALPCRTRRLRLIHSLCGACRLFPVDLYIFLGPAIGHRDHDPQANQDSDANHYPGCVDVLQNAQFPECGETGADQDDEPDKIHSYPFHDAPPDHARFLTDRICNGARVVCVLAYLGMGRGRE
jgi:hypothetical protein